MLASCCRYLPEDTVTVVDPYAVSSLRSSSRPLTPQVVPGGLRAAPPMTTAAAAKWAAAALQGSFRPRSRGLLGGSNGSTLSSQGSGMSPMLMNLLPMEADDDSVSSERESVLCKRWHDANANPTAAKEITEGRLYL